MAIVKRPACLDDVKNIRALELSVWGEEAASEANIRARIKTFAEGSVLLLLDGEILAYCVVEIIDSSHLSKAGMTWDDVTDNGSITKTHTFSGDCLYGVNITASSEASKYNASLQAMYYVQSLMIKYGLNFFSLGARMPGFAKQKKKDPNLTAERYLENHISGDRLDPLLGYFGNLGYVPERVLPGYFPDEDSLDYGVLVTMRNPLSDYPWLVKEISKQMKGE